jgi:hypothetical protein
MSASALNIFQRLARQWDQVHPYNAAQILKLRGAPAVAELQAAWHAALNDLGLGRVRMCGDSFSFECLNGDMTFYEVRRAPAGVGLEDWISAELNRRFDDPEEPPFRPFVLVEDGSYYLGVVYHHWVADSVSIRTVLREWFVRLFDPGKAQALPVRLPHSGYSQFFNLMHRAAAVGHGVLNAVRFYSDLRHVRRIEYRCGTNLTVRFALRTMPAGWIDVLHRVARERQVTLNDLFMAAIALVCDQFVPLKSRPQRRGLALGSIVDLRPYSDTDMADAFGLFLGFTNVVCRQDELLDPEKLLRSISRQNARQKRVGIAQTSALRMLFGLTGGRLVKPEGQAQWYQKHCPLAGGISNVNMSRSWAKDYHPAPLLDYIRVSPTGPMMPLVFATTTLGDSFHVALTYRPSVVGEERIGALTDAFSNGLALYGGKRG